MLIANSPDAFSVNAAICAEMTENAVHFASKNAASTSGVLEFMSDEFRLKFYPELQHIGKDNWIDFPYITNIACHPLSLLF